jgi:type I restriction enzyme, S subunit
MWENALLGDHVSLLTGYPFSSQRYADDEGGIPLLRGDNVIQNRIRWDNVKRWPPGEINGLDTYFLQERDIVLAMDRSWVKAGLKIAQIKGSDLPLLLVQRVARLRGSRTLDTDFLYHVLSTERFVEYVKEVQTETAVPHISARQIKEYTFRRPPLDEQRRIAAVLSTWDRGIEQLERLIAAKERRKRGLMQQLLTGKRRFNQFRDGWDKIRLGDVLSERNESGYTSLPLLSITADRGVVRREEVDRKDTSNQDKSRYKRILSGDIGYNTMRMWQGVSALSDLEGIVSPAYTIVTPQDGVEPSFIAHLFKSSFMVDRFYRYSQGLVDDTRNLKYNNFRQIKTQLPSFQEQRHVAAVLNACDKQLEQHRAKLAALKKQKQGLMQKLLTGKVRVPELTEEGEQ